MDLSDLALMIHQYHMPLDQRHEYERCKCATLGCLRHIAIFSSGDPKHVGSAIGDSRDAKRFLHGASRFPIAVGANQTFRSLPTAASGHLQCQLGEK